MVGIEKQQLKISSASKCLHNQTVQKDTTKPELFLKVAYSPFMLVYQIS